jgi:hypothetical protein
MKITLGLGRRDRRLRDSYRVAQSGTSIPRPKLQRSRRSSRSHKPNRARGQHCPVRSPRRRVGSHLLRRGLTVLVRVVWVRTAPTLHALSHLHLPRNRKRKSRKIVANGQKRCMISRRTYVPLYHFVSFILLVLISLVCRIQPTSVSRLERGCSSRNEAQRTGGRPRTIMAGV